MSKVVGFVIGAALVVVGIATGNVALIIQGGAMIVTQAIVDLTAPKVPARQASEMSIQLGEQPRVAQFGETFTPGSLVDGFDFGGKYGTNWECLVIRLADHKCEGLTGFYVNDEYNAYTGDGNVSRYNGKNYEHLHIYFRSDTSTQPVPTEVSDEWPGWAATDQGESGCDVFVLYRCDTPQSKHPIWPGGRPRFGFVLKGALCYDPRLDDTVTGGSGPHRYDDPTTWEWSENPIICRYKWVRGIYSNDENTEESKLLVGRGLTADEAPPENIIAAANLCDEALSTVTPRLEVKDTNHYGSGLGAFSPDFSKFVTLDASGDGFYDIWDVYSRTLITTGDMPCGVGGFVFNSAGSIYIRTDATHVRTLTSALALSGSAVSVPNASSTIYYAGGFGCLTALTAHHYAQLYDGSTVDAVDVGFQVLSYLHGPDDNAWALGVSGTNIKLAQIVAGVVGTTLTVANVSGGSATPFGLSNSAGNICLIQGTTILVIDVAGTILHSGSRSGTIGRESIINHDGSDTIWSQNYQYSLLDGSLIQSVTYSDWGSGLGTNMYDPINNALFGEKPATDDLNWLFLGTPIRYRIAGPVYSNQEFIDVEGMFASAIAGNIITHEGSVELEPAQAKSVVATITDDDLLVGAQVNWNYGVPSESNSEWVNTVVARYIEPEQKWNDHAAPPARDTAEIIADGKPREASITLRLVRDLLQAQRVAEINHRRGRLWGRATVKLGPRFCELEEGDWITWTSARHGFTKTFRVEAYSIDEKWQITLTLRQISAAVYADDWVFPDDDSVATPTSPPPDIGTPDSANWTLAATTLESAGSSVPALEITGSTSDDETAEAILFEYWKSDGVTDPTVDPDTIPWVQHGGSWAPSTTTVDITAVVSAATYYAAVTYVVSGETGDRLILGPVTVSGLTTTPYRRADTILVTADTTTRRADLA